MDQIVMALTSKHAVAIGLYSHVQYTFSCSPLVADSQLSCKFKPSQDSLRQDEYKRQPPEWHGLLVDQDLYQNATVDPWMSAAAKPCQPDWRRSITVLLIKYFHFPHMLMLWEFAFGVIIHCLIPTVCVTHARWPFILCRFLTREAIGRTSHSFSKTLELLTWIPIFFTFWFCKENEFILPQRVPVYIRLPWVNIIHTYCFNIHRDWNSNISASATPWAPLKVWWYTIV